MWKKIKNSWIATLVFILLGSWVAYGAYRMISQAILFSNEARNTEQKILELRKKRDELESNIAELEARSAIEREAKERLNLKLPGEEVVVVLPGKKEPAASTSSLFESVRNFFRGLGL